MKNIKYKIASSSGDEQRFLEKNIRCVDEVFDANYAIAQKEAYNGEITVEEVAENAEDA